MEPWKERFITEYRELDERTKKLGEMLEKYSAGTLDFEPNCPYDVLHEQYIYMKLYRAILDKRALIEKIEL